MRGFLKFVAIAVTVFLVTAALLLFAYAAEIVWLQWTIAAGIFLWIANHNLQEWEDRKARQHQEILHRLDRIAEMLSRQAGAKPRQQAFFTVQRNAE